MKKVRLTPALLCVVCVACSTATADVPPNDEEVRAQEAATPPPLDGRSTVYAPNGVIATSQPLASAAGLRILEEGGNAFDAAIAASAVLSLVEPHMTGLGGDLFALFWSAEEGRLVGLDATGRAGTRSTPAQIRADGFDRMPGSGPQAVTVPGAIAGWAALNEKYGSMPLEQILERAIELGESGFPVSPIIARQWGEVREKLSRDPGAAATYLIDGQAPKAGDWFTNPDFSKSLRMIASEGRDAMYGGALGRTIVDGLAEVGGYLTHEDMAAMEVRWVEPISTDYKGWTLHELPPAGQGIAALQMLELVEPFDLKGMGHNSPEYLHVLIEAKKLAFADLARYVADADHMRVTTDDLLDPDYLDERRSMIDMGQAMERVEPGELVTHSETIYLSVADQYGNQVSFIHSIFSSFGSGIVVPGTGFVLQNRGAGFTLEDGHANQVAPGKRPFHTLIPGFISRDGEPYAAFGVMGGSMQPQGHTQVFLNMLEFGMDPQEAIDAARFRHVGGQRVVVENVTPELQAGLEALGHDIRPFSGWRGHGHGGGQIVVRLDRGWAAGSDARKDGAAMGH